MAVNQIVRRYCTSYSKGTCLDKGGGRKLGDDIRHFARPRDARHLRLSWAHRTNSRLVTSRLACNNNQGRAAPCTSRGRAVHGTCGWNHRAHMPARGCDALSQGGKVLDGQIDGGPGPHCGKAAHQHANTSNAQHPPGQGDVRHRSPLPAVATSSHQAPAQLYRTKNLTPTRAGMCGSRSRFPAVPQAASMASVAAAATCGQSSERNQRRINGRRVTGIFFCAFAGRFALEAGQALEQAAWSA